MWVNSLQGMPQYSTKFFHLACYYLLLDSGIRSSKSLFEKDPDRSSMVVHLARTIIQSLQDVINLINGERIKGALLREILSGRFCCGNYFKTNQGPKVSELRSYPTQALDKLHLSDCTIAI
jgi:hypothetical protein